MRRGELWLVRADKPRPAVVLTRDPVADKLNEVLVAMVTRTVRGLHTEVALEEADEVRFPCVANLDMTERLHRTMFIRRVGRVRPSTMEEICSAMHHAIGC